MVRHVRVESITDLFSSELFVLQDLHVHLDDGPEVVTFERLHERRTHSVIMVAVTSARQVSLVREFAAGPATRILKLPTGLVEAGETAEETARRELREELGLDSRRVERLARIRAQPGHSDAFTDVVLMRELFESPAIGDEIEQLDIVAWPLSDFDALVADGRLADARTIAALSIAAMRLR
jgi:ADP-ribose diphosphatase